MKDSLIQTKLTCAVLFAFTFVLAGCITEGKDRFKKPSAGFQTHVVYDTSLEKAWKAVNDALDKNRIPVLSSDQASGRIQTDTVAGPTTSPALMWVDNSRYSYNIRVTHDDAGKTKILILAKIEVAHHQRNNNMSYEDQTPANHAAAKDLENWLYEQIEKAL
jgi:hypothetical protein